MPEPSSPIQFEDMPLDDARCLSCGPRLEPLLDDSVRKHSHSLSTGSPEATRSHLGSKITPARMNRYFRCIARDLISCHRPTRAWLGDCLACPRGGSAAGVGDCRPAANGTAERADHSPEARSSVERAQALSTHTKARNGALPSRTCSSVGCK